MRNEGPIGFQIKSIKEEEFFVNESLQLDPEIDQTLSAGLDVKIESSEIRFIIYASFKRKLSGEEYLRSRVVSCFYFENLKSRQFTRADGKLMIDLPHPLWVTLFSISYSHARAILAKSSAGTKYGHMLLPIVDPEEQFKIIFKDELKGQPDEKLRDKRQT